jgi:hypothetical protein
MIGRMVGRVTEDTTLQIIPQARAYPVRPSLTPLTGATITGHRPNGLGNGYTLTYTLAGQTDSIEYHWTQTGQYQYNFYTAGTGIPVTQNYNGFSQCTVPTAVVAEPASLEFSVYPNPAHEQIRLRLPTGITLGEVSSTVAYSVEGREVFRQTGFSETISTTAWLPGTYFLVLELSSKRAVSKLVIR